MTNEIKFLDMATIMGKDAEEITALKTGEFEAERLGLVAFTAIDNEEYRQIKKDCVKMVPSGTGGMQPEVDEDKMMTRVVIAAVNKDKRSDFTFNNKELLQKFGVITADGLVSKLLLPGEITNFAMDIQEISGFGPRAKKAVREEVKNS